MSDLTELTRAIGALEAHVQNLDDRIVKEADDALTHRRSLHIEVNAISMAVARLADEMREIKPLAFDFRERRAEGKGRNQMLKFLWAAVVALATATGALLSRALDHLNWK